MNPTNPDPLRTSIDVAVLFADGSAGNVKVRELPVKLFAAGLNVMMDELAFVELVTMQPKGWSETLTPASLTLVATAAEEVNAGFFDYCERRMKTVNRIAPGVIGRAIEASRS